jgi:hypothetical protein
MSEDIKKDLSEIELKVYAVLFEGKQNEYSDEIHSLNAILSKKIIPKRKIPTFQELYNSREENQKIIEMRKKTMNKKLIFSLVAAILIAGITFAIKNFSSSSVEQPTMQAKITFLTGEVKIKDASGQEKPKVGLGTMLDPNDTVITGNRSSVEVEFSDKNKIRLKSNSEFSLKKLSLAADSSEQEVFLQRGMLVAEIKKQKQTDNFKVTTPTVIAGVRGTKFQVEVNPQKGATETTKVTVSEGSVGITKRTKEGLPETPEPVQILEASEVAIEKGFGGEISKLKVSEEKINQEFAATNDVESEKDLAVALGRSEIEKITLEDKTVLRGVILEMDENFFVIQTLNGIIKVNKEKVVSSELEPIK